MTHSVVGQLEASNWYFGNNAALTFNNGSPEPLQNSMLETLEGCATISTSEGDLLFYTDGEKVWNRFHQVMANGAGLLGSFSATQSAMIIPKPGSTRLYYIFTADVVQAYEDGGTGNGFNYSVVDMNLGGTLGTVIEKNVSLLPNGSEKISAISTSDGLGFWVITHYRDQFYAYLVTENGIDPTPVISTIGPDISSFVNIRGGMKMSPNGEKLAIAHALFDPDLGGEVRLYDFNSETGVVSNEELLADDLIYYGLEFSSDSSKLFASGKSILPIGQNIRSVDIIQFDVTQSNIPNTRFLIASTENRSMSDLAGTLQLAVNKKIYHSIPDNTLSVINAPNVYGDEAGFSDSSVLLGGRDAKFGLPPFIQSYFEGIINIENFCFGTTTQFSVSPSDNITSIFWDFGDPDSDFDNTSSLLNPSHDFTGQGTFMITVVVQFTNRATKTFIEFVDIGSLAENVEIVVTNQVGHTVTVLVDDPSLYQFAIVGVGDIQSSNVFPGIVAGFYTVQIWRGECLVYEELINVGGIPNFFTPNGDGFHDVWNVRGIDRFNSVKIYIFDRFGKLLKELNSSDLGWDGTYNGQPLPSSDYWYSIEIEQEKTLRGNFTLKR